MNFYKSGLNEETTMSMDMIDLGPGHSLTGCLSTRGVETRIVGTCGISFRSKGK